MGGKEDELIDTSQDRHDDIFPNLQALTAAGYEDQEKSDLMAALLPTNKIGIVANNIPRLLRLQGTKSFSLAQKNGLKAAWTKLYLWLEPTITLPNAINANENFLN